MDSAENGWLRVADTGEELAAVAAERLVLRTGQAIEDRGRAVLALSGGRTPWPAFERFSTQDLDWGKVHLFQTDERQAPRGSPERNLTALERLFRHRAHLHPMPVDGDDLEAGAKAYAAELMRICGPRPRLDLVQLGLGEDGHTASLFAADPALGTGDLVIATREHAGWRRMTLSLKTINSASHRLWLVAGPAKRAVLQRLLRGDRSIPAGAVSRRGAVILADSAAAGGAC